MHEEDRLEEGNLSFFALDISTFRTENAIGGRVASLTQSAPLRLSRRNVTAHSNSQIYHVIYMLIFKGRVMKQESARDPLRDLPPSNRRRLQGDPSPRGHWLG